MVDLHHHRAAFIAEGVTVIGQALGNITAQLHPAVVLHIFDFSRGSEVGVIIDKATLLGLRLGLCRRWAREATLCSKNRGSGHHHDGSNCSVFFHLNLSL